MISPCFAPASFGASRPFLRSVANRRRHHHHRSAASAIHALPPQPQQHHDAAISISSAVVSALPTTLTSVKVFDGSEITDSVVISGTFWSTLTSQLPYLLLSQLLAAITFVAIASVVTAQGKFVLDQVSSKIEDDNDIRTRNGKSARSTSFRRATDPAHVPTTPTLDFSKLFLCICIDILGSANEAIPLVGELVDVIYAPVAALLLRRLFSGSNIVFLLEFAEEILPLTDVLPLATICWVVEAFYGTGNLARALGIGQFAPNGREGSVDAIDVPSTTKAKEGGTEKDGSNFLLESKENDNFKR